jgi:hypothetical protein
VRTPSISIAIFSTGADERSEALDDNDIPQLAVDGMRPCKDLPAPLHCDPAGGIAEQPDGQRLASAGLRFNEIATKVDY